MFRNKKTGIMAAIAILMMILIVPTLIVVPFIGKGDEQQVTETTAEETLEALDKDLSPFDVRVLRTATEKVESVPIEEYVSRVVASEMPVEFNSEALKAQALAARTYITKHLINESAVSEQADVTDTVQHQVYKNEQELRKQWQGDYIQNMTKINQAVAATAGKIITYQNEPIEAAFFSTSNGKTENSEDYWEQEVPYLKSVESPWDEESPKYMDQKVLTVAELESALGVDLPATLPQMNMTRTEGERVEEVTVAGQTFTGRDIREKLKLQSSDFTIKQNGEHIIFTTKGYGHGIGMSQYGANGMAKDGSTYEDIIHHYYKGTKITPFNKLTASISEFAAQ
ncbi:stage II sporulation protein D [Thalassobacillus sp. CUG 92003]|uniref:stage II sporulation protein D n=1 Tax=Thalassobacillus sp. CUG 92003 TaxID=2736641 RepID=UPI0015E6BD8F|nr:stage II sporulation protein D [Thalassobacillus sp. CUG 92003]